MLSPTSAYGGNPLQGKYLLDFYPIRTTLGSPNLSADQASKIARGINFAYTELSAGKFQFEFGLLANEIPNISPLKVPNDVDNLIANIKRTNVSGYLKVISIGVIAYDSAIPYAGIASVGGNTILLNGNRDSISSTVNILNHEIGHNLGMGHGNSIVCSNKFPDQIKCQVFEYGDRFDTMGSYPNYYRTDAYMRLSGFHLEDLGLLESPEKIFIFKDSEIELDGLYSGAKGSPKVAFLPVSNSLGYSIEYRPAVKIDEKMDDVRIDVPNKPGYYWDASPAYGLQIRVLGTKAKENTFFPSIQDVDEKDSYLFVNDSLGRQGYDPGYSQTLPDGSNITFVAVNPNGTARVKITRPKDSKLPSVGELMIQDSQQSLWNDAIELNRGENGVFVPKVVKISSGDLSDDFAVTRVSLIVNGVTVKEISGLLSTPQQFEYSISQVGQSSIQIVAFDDAGNRGESPKRVISVREFRYAKPRFDVESGPDPQTSVKVTVVADSSPFGSLEFAMNELNDGRITSKQIVGNKATFTIEGLKRNGTLNAVLAYRDIFGNESESESIVAEVDPTECDSRKCFVGVEWTPPSLYWRAKMGPLLLQQKIGKQWKTVASATSVISNNGPKGYPYTHYLRWVPSVPGKYTFRFHIAATKKTSEWSGSTFVQVVIP